jgi:hypothetical protein
MIPSLILIRGLQAQDGVGDGTVRIGDGVGDGIVLFGIPIGGSTGLSGEEDFMPIMALELETIVTVEELHIILLLTDEVLLSQDGVIPWQVEEEMSPSSGTGILRQDANQAQPM